MGRVVTPECNQPFGGTVRGCSITGEMQADAESEYEQTPNRLPLPTVWRVMSYPTSRNRHRRDLTSPNDIDWCLGGHAGPRARNLMSLSLASLSPLSISQTQTPTPLTPYIPKQASSRSVAGCRTWGSCITQLEFHRPSRTCYERQEEEDEEAKT